MLSSLLLFTLFSQPKEITIEPTDDVWVYQFAEDQSADEFLRVWSTDGQAVGEITEGHMSFSYSCLKFDVSKFEGMKLMGAKLVMTHVGKANFAANDSKKYPLEVRSLKGDWNEKSWQYENSAKVHPDKDEKTIFGTGFGGPTPNEEPFKIEVDLMSGASTFAKAFDEGVKSASHSLALSLTSKFSPQDQEGFVYKMYSRSNDVVKRPKLILTFEDGTSLVQQAALVRSR